MIENSLFLFVDFDGILATNEDWILCGRKDDRFFDIRNRKIQAIEKIVRNHITCPIYFVPISAWGHAFESAEMLNEFLNERQVSFKAFDKQHYIENHTAKERVEGIKKFIEKFEVENYIILDDECNQLYKDAGLNYIIYDVNMARYYSNLHVNIDENFKHLTNKK